MNRRMTLGSLFVAGLVGLSGCSISGGAGPDPAVSTSNQRVTYSPSDRPPAYTSASYQDRAAVPDRAPEPRRAAGPQVSPIGQGMVRFTLAYPTGARESSVLLLEADGPEQVRVGQPFNYTLRVTNLTDTPLHGVVVNELAHSVEGGPAKSAAHEHADDPAIAASAKSDADDQPAPHRDLAAWEVGTLAPHQAQTHQVNGVADEVGSLKSCLSVRYTPALCTAITVVKPELQLTKEGPSDVLICQNITYRYVVTNPGTGVAAGVRLTDTLPEGLAVANGGGREVALNVGDLRAGESREQTVVVRAARTGKFESRATAVSGDGPDALKSQSREVTTTVREPVLATAVEAPESRYVGEPIDYRVTVRNTGDARAEHAVLHLTSATGERMADRDLGTINVGESKTVPLSIHAPDRGGALRLTATAEAQCARPAAATASVDILTVPALLLEAVDSIDPVRVGGSTVYTITVLNQGTGADHNVRVRATVPAEEQYMDASGATAVTRDGQALTMAPIPTLEPKQSATWKVEVKGVRPADVVFNVEMTSDSLTKPGTKGEPTRIVGDAADHRAVAPDDRSDHRAPDEVPVPRDVNK